MYYKKSQFKIVNKKIKIEHETRIHVQASVRTASNATNAVVYSVAYLLNMTL
jgi:hypothetical protein